MTAVRPYRVLVVDDHPLFRAGLATTISADPRLEVVADTGSGERAVDLALRERPDLVVVDLKLPGVSGIAVAQRILAQLPDTKAVILTGQETEESLRQSVEAGIQGYLLKTSDADVLVGALVTVLAGGHVAPSMLVHAADGVPAGHRDRLTSRELEVLRLLAAGLGNKQIARSLGISEKTARNHVTHIYEKLHVHHRTDAVRYAIRKGIVEP